MLLSNATLNCSLDETLQKYIFPSNLVDKNSRHELWKMISDQGASHKCQHKVRSDMAHVDRSRHGCDVHDSPGVAQRAADV